MAKVSSVGEEMETDTLGMLLMAQSPTKRLLAVSPQQ